MSEPVELNEPLQSTIDTRPEPTPAPKAAAAAPAPAAAATDADRNLRREKKRLARRRREEADFILGSLEDNGNDGKRVLYLQEVPRVKASHCRAWDCAIKKVAREPIIRSHYRLALKGGVNMYGGELVEYYHITCIERIIPNLADLVVNGHLKLGGWVCAPPDTKISVESSTDAIKDWFKYGGRTFDINCYERFKRDHKEWSEDYSFHCITHQLRHKEKRDEDCWYCEGGPPKPAEPSRNDYFPEEPTAIGLSRLLAVVSDQPHIDQWWRWRREEGEGDPA
ncbi:hypothetical protein BJX62DRAFT_226544 [Aspergillus germanicus]